MDYCFYCGGPLQPEAGKCRFCGSPVDPLDVPLCESEPAATLDEPVIVQVSEVEPPQVILYEDPDAESVSGTPVPQADSAREETPESEVSEVPGKADGIAAEAEPEKPDAREPEIRFDVQAIPETDHACVIIGYRGEAGGRLAVPEEIEGMNVVEIGKSAFAHGGFREASLPESLQRIGDYAFTMCMGLETISGGGNVREIGRGVFNGCLRLKQCAFLFNPGLRKPGDPMLDRIIQKLNSDATADSGDQV